MKLMDVSSNNYQDFMESLNGKEKALVIVGMKVMVEDVVKGMTEAMEEMIEELEENMKALNEEISDFEEDDK